MDRLMVTPSSMAMLAQVIQRLSTGLLLSMALKISSVTLRFRIPLVMGKHLTETSA